MALYKCIIIIMMMMIIIMQVYTKAERVLIASIICVSCRDTNQFSISSSQVIKVR